ncbi:MAG: ATP-binding protein [Pseudomonadota bacterium]
MALGEVDVSFASKNLIRLAGKAIAQFEMIKPQDRILVGLSGGKDSTALLWFLTDRLDRIPISYSILAVHLDMGYEDRQQKAGLERYVTALGVEKYFAVTDYARAAHGGSQGENACFLCSRSRRRRLFELARDFGCNKVALGHHRDDLNETLLMNIFFSGEISTMMPVQEFFGGLLTVIRPLCMVPENTIARAASEHGLPLVENRCPSNGRTKRSEVKEIISRLSGSNDKVKGNIFRSMSNVRTDYLLVRPRPGQK